MDGTDETVVYMINFYCTISAILKTYLPMLSKEYFHLQTCCYLHFLVKIDDYLASTARGKYLTRYP